MKHVVAMWDMNMLSYPEKRCVLLDIEKTPYANYIAFYPGFIKERVDGDMRKNRLVSDGDCIYSLGWKRNKSKRLIDVLSKNCIVMSQRLWGSVFKEEMRIKVNGEHFFVNVSCAAIPKGYYIGNDVVFFASPKKEGNFFDWQRVLRYSSGVPRISDDGKWLVEGRQNMKPSKFINLFKDWFRVTDNDGETVDDVSVFESVFRRFVELRGETLKPFDINDIKVSDKPSEVYAMRTGDGSGSLGSSCMRSESSYDCQSYAHVYDDMGCKVAYLERGGCLVARALLWETNEGYKVMDRIYGSESAIEGFKEWAKKNGYLCKESQDSSSRVFVLSGRDVIGDLSVSCYLDEDDGCPYMDTFVYYSPGLLSTDDGEYTLQECDGRPFGDKRIECYNCGRMIDEDNAIYVDDDPYCDECAVITVDGDNILLSDAIYLEYIRYVRDEGYYNEDDCVLVGGTWYHEDDVVRCPNCGRLFPPQSQEIDYIEVTGDEVCNYCIDEYMNTYDLEYVDGEIVEKELETT